MPEPIRQWLDAHRNTDVVGQLQLTHDDFSMVDHRPLGYGTMDSEDAAAFFTVRDEDATLRGVPVYSVIHRANEQACVLAGAMWTQAGAGDYWIGLPFITAYGAADHKLRTIDLFAEDDLAVATAHFTDLSERPEPTSAERWSGELTAMVDERRLEEFVARLVEDFTEDSRRTGFAFVLDRDDFVARLHIFVERVLSMESIAVVATAGDLAGLHRCSGSGEGAVSTFLQIGVFDTDGNLTRLIEFDDDRLDVALAELAHITGEPVRLLGLHST